MKRDNNKHLILTNDTSLISRTDYEDWCADCGDIEPTDSGFLQYQIDETECSLESDLYDIEHTYNFPVLVEGRLGLWWGTPEVIPTRFESVKDALFKCLEDDCIFNLWWVDGHLELSVAHHDGTHHFTISSLSAKGLKKGEFAQWKKYHTKRMKYLYAV